jgi:hypothetical protein
MHIRRVLLVSLLVVAGCQDKKPDGAPAPISTGTPAETTAATVTTTPTTMTTATPEPEPLAGTLFGKPFRPQEVSVEAMKSQSLLIFRQKDGEAESGFQIQLPVPETEKLTGREWQFGDKADDPVLLLLPAGKKEPINVLAPEYTAIVRLTKHARDVVEGFIDIKVKKPEGTSLRGRFRAAYHRSPTGPLDAADAPFIRGKIVVKHAKKTEKLAAGYVGIGADGQAYFNEAGYPIQIGEPGYSNAPSPQRATQISWLSSDEDGLAYRHLNVPPGDYLVYLRRDTVMSAWKRIKLTEGDQQSIDFTIDPATTGEVVVNLPEPVATNTSLALVPAKAGLPELGLGSEHYFNVATVSKGEKTVKVSGIPAGKYRAVCGTDEAEIEVATGKSVAATLVPAKK